MVPLLHQQQYEELKQRFAQLGLCISDAAALKVAIAEVHQWFRQHILTLNLDELTPVDQQRVQSVQVEINKQLRLLGVDALFLQTSRQRSTTEQRQQQVYDRLQTLIRYCEAVLQPQAKGE